MAQRQFKSDDTSQWDDRFGSGADGAYTTAGNVTDSARTGYSNTSITGTSGETAATAGAVGNFVAGDLVVIHQSRGTGAGNWELNKISSTGAGTNWTLSYALCNTYASPAQVYRLLQYSAVTIDTGHTLTGVAWAGTSGGIVALLCNGTTTVTGNITVIGGQRNAHKGGFQGGDPAVGTGTGTQGESSTGAPASSRNANGAGGGAGGNSINGTGGGTDGGASLVDMNFGGAAGGSQCDASYTIISTECGGGDGGGIVLIISKIITVTGTIVANGGPGQPGYNTDPGGGAGPGGAGGSILLKGQTLTLGTTLVTATGGAAGGVQGRGYPAGSGGHGVAGTSGSGQNAYAGGVGRIHADYSTSISGTTNPTLDSTLDTTLADSGPKVVMFI